MKCRYPIQVNIKGREIYVPCGHCAWCLKRLRDEWFTRLKFEGSKALFKSFVTLTYRDDDLPFEINDETGELVPSVCVKDIQDFHKRCRKDVQFRFMLCSEYGPRTHRPHYHGVYFHNEPYDFTKKWYKGDNNSQYPAKDGSYKYIIKYVLKGSEVPEGAAKNFRLMSRRPGLGSCFVYKGDPYILGEDGVHLAVPRYYKRNYENSLSEKLRYLRQEDKLDLLSDRPQHFEFHQEFDRLVEDGSINIETTSFEDWLSNKYKIDYQKQVKINKK